MKNRIFFVLPLAAALTVPAMAQQASNDSTQNQPAATQNSDNQNLSARQPLTAERHEGFWGKLNPFARKKYVQRQMEQLFHARERFGCGENTSRGDVARGLLRGVERCGLIAAAPLAQHGQLARAQRGRLRATVLVAPTPPALRPQSST